jgi:hypothetical protein
MYACMDVCMVSVRGRARNSQIFATHISKLRPYSMSRITGFSLGFVYIHTHIHIYTQKQKKYLLNVKNNWIFIINMLGFV